MFFKFSSKNPYRDLVRNAKKIILSNEDDTTKYNNLSQLYELLGPKMAENELFLNSTPAFSTRCEHWNQIDVQSIKPVTTSKNPWLAFKRDFADALKLSPEKSCIEISRALGWFNNVSYRDDWAA